MILGVTASGPLGGDDILLLKLDNLGNVLWSKAYGGLSNERGITIEKSLDGGYIIGANTYSYPIGKNNLYLVKVDPLGNLEWNWTFGNTNKTATQISDIITLPDSSIVISGTYDGSPSSGNSYVARLDKNGILLWINRYTYSGNSGWEGISGLEYFNNTIIAAGVTRGSLQIGGLSDGLVISLDFNGIINWSKVYGGLGNEFFYKVDTDINQNLNVVSYSNSVGFGGYDMGLLKIDTLGNLINYSTFGSSGTEHAKSYSNTSDGGALFSGFTTGFGAIQNDGFIIKLDSNWLVGCNASTSIFNESAVLITPQALVAPINTTGSEMALALFSSNVSITMDTLCKDITSGVSLCNIVSNFSNSNTCFGDSTLFNDLSIDSIGTIVNWHWYFGDGDSVVGVNNPTHLYTTSGTFNVTLGIVNSSNCTDSISIPITINPSYSMGRVDTICQGDSVLLGGVFQYVNGIYTDSLQTVLGCDSLILTSLTVNPSYRLIYTQTICKGDSVLLGGVFQNSNGVYTDNLQTEFGCDSITSTTLVVLSDISDSVIVAICEGESVFLGGSNQMLAGLYVDTLQTVGTSCDSVVLTTLVVNPNPIIITLNDTLVNACESVGLEVTGAVSYSWVPADNLSCKNCSNPIFTALSTTLFTVTGITNGCSTVEDVLITVDGESELIIPNVFSPNHDGINDGFNISGGCIISIDKKIYNRWGELLFSSKHMDEVWNGRTTSGKEVPEGTYFYIFKTEIMVGGNLTSKFFKGTVSLLR